MERFCNIEGDSNTHDVYVLAKLDSYDDDPYDGIKGQVDETLETNNVAAATAYQIGNLDCSGGIDLQSAACAYPFTLTYFHGF